MTKKQKIFTSPQLQALLGAFDAHWHAVHCKPDSPGLKCGECTRLATRIKAEQDRLAHK